MSQGTSTMGDDAPMNDIQSPASGDGIVLGLSAEEVLKFLGCVRKTSAVLDLVVLGDHTITVKDELIGASRELVEFIEKAGLHHPRARLDAEGSSSNSPTGVNSGPDVTTGSIAATSTGSLAVAASTPVVTTESIAAAAAAGSLAVAAPTPVVTTTSTPVVTTTPTQTLAVRGARMSCPHPGCNRLISTQKMQRHLQSHDSICFWRDRGGHRASCYGQHIDEKDMLKHLHSHNGTGDKSRPMVCHLNRCNNKYHLRETLSYHLRRHNKRQGETDANPAQ